MMQAELGETVPDGAPLRRGDLVFWKGHVGLLQDAHRLLHANGHHMQVVSEPFAEARQRIAEKSFGDVVAIKRL
jgi:cell wall-associated NlpC family hydrolase